MRTRSLANPARQAFLRAIRQPHPDLVDAALCIAWEDQNCDNRPATLQGLTDHANHLAPRLAHTFTLIKKIDIINEYLFDEVGFVGNSDNYYAATNSFLDYVVTHKTGLPIMLSILYMAIARRVEIGRAHV